MPSTLVRVMHRSCRIVAESSTTNRDLLVIPTSLRHTQQTHEAFNRSQLSIGHRIKLRANQRACRVSRQKLEQLVIQHGESLLVRQQCVDHNQANYAVLDLQWYARARFLVAGLAKERLTPQGYNAFQSFTRNDVRLLGPACRLALVAGANECAGLIVYDKESEVLRADHVQQDLFYALDHF